ncbi:MAG: TIGR03617 family F420-dependent LLM class oxidoreductase [Chloroflexi bacterium]|nr:TIGR03617 family F420-dependent LLM class oxidoreductase [Chloroflexota bacterium]
MQFDTFFPPYTKLIDIPEMASAAEEIGFDAIWVAETQHNPFLPCVLIAEHTKNIQFGTAIAVSFARSPAVMAQVGWDLSEASGGRFMLGLGTQVKAHIERRFGMPWPKSPVGKLREQLAGIRAIWRNWQTGEKLNQRGEYYKLTLTSPFFTPASIESPEIPIYIAGVNTGLAHLAGETADGFQVHPLNTPKYLREVIIPAIEDGAAKAGRNREDVSIAINAFVVTNDTERSFVRQQVSFYASTPSYRRVLALHGWEDIGAQLSKLAAKKQWDRMPDLISDEMLGEFATVADEADLPEALQERYAGLGDRITIYTPFVPGDRDEFWRHMRSGFPKF